MPRPECCKDDDNLKLEDETRSGDTVTREYVCEECGRSHYKAEAKPFEVGMSVEGN